MVNLMKGLEIMEPFMDDQILLRDDDYYISLQNKNDAVVIPFCVEEEMYDLGWSYDFGCWKFPLFDETDEDLECNKN